MSTAGRVLVAEDDRQAREALRALLEEEGYAVETAADGREAAAMLDDGAYDAVLMDLRMPGRDGLSLLHDLAHRAGPPAVLIMTAYGTSEAAIEAMKLGAYDYLTKPLRFDELLIQLERAIAQRRLAVEAAAAHPPGETEPVRLVGSSPAMQEMYKLIGLVAPTDATVLIRGESGTGKELVARAIHDHSPRREHRLVAVNCAAIPESLLEAELFGYERGAFTGAVGRRAGKFEAANQGTLFLDEVGELSAATQARLLRVLQERTVERLGSHTPIRLDVRVLAATNRDLESMVRDGRFREDLYYRLLVVSIAAPPLRSRREDVPALAAHLVDRLARRLRLPASPLAPEADRILKERDWPGNVRELEHCLERALILSRGGPILPEHLDVPASSPAQAHFDALDLSSGFHELVSRLERRLIERALEASGGNKTKAAEIPRINRRLLYDKLEEFGLG